MGIVSAVAKFFADREFSIVESSQHTEPSSRQFFMRTLLSGKPMNAEMMDEITTAFDAIARSFEMSWSFRSTEDKLKTVIAVSKWDHCLKDLLHAWKTGDLPLDIVAVVSNHDDLNSMATWYGVPFYHLPVTPDTKPQQEAQMLKVMEDTGSELMLLARYMQILSDDLCKKLQGRAINIHHSFLPGFKGAKPYHQAYEKGVKLVGATAHYVTADLDEGPIIEQDVFRVAHSDDVDVLVTAGRQVESRVLMRAAKWHAEGRVMMTSSRRTVVFDR
ncbi:formyltetrahydrofolate deformylase [Luminiphilus syltensis NOR5-1B]|uniref:Formyltetrahydrofolate deformylase n=1 Tax=Luminiphilus syltensis NOR5-1B TaxID=565045 RepID=B8KY46_9GAMM|nr:formyltetrahydrofolate deformylase [Luminiphilus syltensis NOR5-1B]